MTTMTTMTTSSGLRNAALVFLGGFLLHNADLLTWVAVAAEIAGALLFGWAGWRAYSARLARGTA